MVGVSRSDSTGGDHPGKGGSVLNQGGGGTPPLLVPLGRKGGKLQEATALRGLAPPGSRELSGIQTTTSD
jgi:hypothetical protein